MFDLVSIGMVELMELSKPLPRVKRRRTSQRRMKQRLYWRDNGLCAYCNRLVTYVDATIDHVVPLVRGGARDRKDNAVIACANCNRKKGPLELESMEGLDVEALQRRWASLDHVRQAE